MKKYITLFALPFLLFLTSCDEKPEDAETLKVGICPDYPPFEYLENGKEIKGSDVDLAELIAKELGKKVSLKSMAFNAIFPSLNTNQVDVGISTITITEERKKNFDFSSPYSFSGIAIIFKKEAPIRQKNELEGKKIACQIGSTVHIWLKEHAKKTTVSTLAYNPETIEALKSGHVDGVAIDSAQAAIFVQKNPSLGYTIIEKDKNGICVALKKNSPLTAKVSEALKRIKENGELKKIQIKWNLVENNQ